MKTTLKISGYISSLLQRCTRCNSNIPTPLDNTCDWKNCKKNRSSSSSSRIYCSSAVQARCQSGKRKPVEGPRQKREV